MKDGFIKVAAAKPEISVADVDKNLESIKNLIIKADSEKVNLLVFPELCLTGYTCGDLFFSQTLIDAAKSALDDLVEFSNGKYPIFVVGLPLFCEGKLYDCAAVVANGEILGYVPKWALNNDEKRYFSAEWNNTDIDGVPFFYDLIFKNKQLQDYSFSVVVGNTYSKVATFDFPITTNTNIFLNPAFDSELAGKAELRELLVKAESLKLSSAYVLANADNGESTTDTVCGGHLIIAESGTLLDESKPFNENNLIISEVDVNMLSNLKRKNNCNINEAIGTACFFDQSLNTTTLTRKINPSPFTPKDFSEPLTIAAHGLKKRIARTWAKKAVIGISGGLDSTLALIITAYAMKLLNRPMTDIICVTMPCFGTTKRTRGNSEILCEALGVDFREVNIADAVKQHFKDINQPENTFDVTFENAQARERTQVIMDIANQCGGIVIGTGDLSESALGWATYNGDHMSMYGVNAGIPKTLVRQLVNFVAENTEGELKAVLLDILGTPVSPELLPTDDKGDIAQKTEDLVGPYELHDFFIYNFVYYNFTPKKIYRLAKIAFDGVYSDEVIKKWLSVFARRFVNNQFKRSCMPDGPMVNEVSLSPRGALRLPSDAAAAVLLKEIESL